jgi:hypothetical protein
MLGAGTGTMDRTIPLIRGGETSLTLGRVALWAMLGAKLLASLGLHWDIQWHLRVGRDSFWIAPHVMTYAGVGLVFLIAFGVLARETWRHRSVAPPASMVRMLGLVGSRGEHIAAWGVALTVLAAPIDDLWHRLFGIDVTLWSPPHLLGLAGGAVNSLGCVMLAREIYDARSRTGLAATLISVAMFYGTLRIVAGPTFNMAYLDGGVAFHAFAILAALMFPFALVPAARLTGRRAAPIAVSILSASIAVSGDVVARVGFDLLQPVSVIEEEIARDPTSAIAVTNLIARTTGERPGTISLVPVLAALACILVLVGVDARRRPVRASVAYGVALFTVFGWLLAHSPAFGARVPGVAATAVALALTVAAGFTGGAGGARLARLLEP